MDDWTDSVQLSDRTVTEESHLPQERRSSYSSRIHDPIYEEAYEFDDHSFESDFEASAPMYENVDAPCQEVSEGGVQSSHDITGTTDEVERKLLANQTHIDNLMSQLTRKIVRQRTLSCSDEGAKLLDEEGRERTTDCP